MPADVRTTACLPFFGRLNGGIYLRALQFLSQVGLSLSVPQTSRSASLPISRQIFMISAIPVHGAFLWLLFNPATLSGLMDDFVLSLSFASG